MAHSDIWRSTRHADKARDLALVTRGISDYFGTACADRAYKVTWGPIANTYGGTDVKGKQVILNPALLDKCGTGTPFSGEAVDLMQGVAAHEAGHVIINTCHREREGGLVRNLVEDMMIDGPAYGKFNPELSRLTDELRSNTAEEELPAIDAFWREGPTPATRTQLLLAWGCGRLFGSKLPQIIERKYERETVELLDAVADSLFACNTFTGHVAGDTMRKAIEDIKDILERYEVSDEQAPAQDNKDDPSEGSEGENGLGSEPRPAGTPSSGPSGGTSDSDKDDGDADDGDESTPKPNSSNSGSSGSGSGSGASAGKDAKWEDILPRNPCPSQRGASKLAMNSTDAGFWLEVADELVRLEIAKPTLQGKVYLDKYTDKKTVAGVKAAYAALASEPSRQRHHDSGRVDRRRLAYAGGGADDVFTRQKEVILTGRIVLILDLSGSMDGQEKLVKASAASVYTALSSTDFDVFIYSYGRPFVTQLANPKQALPAFDLVQANGGTPTAQVFEAVLEEVPVQRSGENVIIHITDGQADSPVRACEQMKKARASGWRVVNIGVGNDARDVAEYKPVSDSVQHIESYKQLPGVLNVAVKDIVRGHKARRV